MSADTAAALGIVTDGAYRRKLMRENGIFFQLLSSGKIQIHVSAEHRPELNPIFATEGITPIRTSIESDAQYLVTSSALARLQARAKSV
ncbi:MAG: hypothetical protein DDT37_01626 [Firmicutes bacterium]|nr:hypothetical protein [candidate division NPL-UPA2 bacterium]